MSGFAAARRVLENAIGSRVFPAATAEVGDSADALWKDALGTLTFDADARETRVDTRFDLASLTKVIATATAMMDCVSSGALTLGALRAPSLSLLFVTGFLSCAGLVVMSLVDRFGVAAVALFALGWISVMVVAGCQVALQLAAPDRLRGRIMSLHTFIYGGVFPFGAFTIGSISEHWGVSWAFRVAGLFGLGGLSLVVAWWRLRARGA